MKNKKNIIIIPTIALSICIILIIIFSIAYSKYITDLNSTTKTSVANIICKMNVVPSEADSKVINPYCTIEVKNYDENDVITDVNLNYKIEVKAKGEYNLPKYYWSDSEGNIISYEEALTGSMQCGVKEEETFKIYFINPGVEEITRSVEFNIVAIQAN